MGTLTDGFRRRASRKLEESSQYLNSANYSESVFASIECMEFAAKAAFLMLRMEYPKRHEFRDDEFEALLDQIPESARCENFPKLFLNYKFWQSFYTTAKYGDEKLNVAADQLFGKREAELAHEHAQNWHTALQILQGAMP